MRTYESNVFLNDFSLYQRFLTRVDLPLGLNSLVLGDKISSLQIVN